MTKLLLVGESCTDEYIFGTCDRICPEAAAISFKHTSGNTKQNLGMAANVLSNLRAINDSLEIDFITNQQSKIIKRRFVDERYNTIVFREDIDDRCERIAVEQYSYNQYDYIVFSDYCKGFLDIHDIIWICVNKQPEAKVFIDTKKQAILFAKYIDYLKINEKEYLNLIDAETVSKLCNIVVTKGKHGASLISKDSITHFPTEQIGLVDVCGAGDTFLAAIVSEYSRTLDIDRSINYANLLSAKVVNKLGVCTP